MFSEKVHRYLFLFGACALALGMMLGTVPTSVPQFILLGNWLLEMDFKRKWNQLRTNRFFWILSSVFLIHVIGLIYTEDLKAGWDDVRTKIPLMFLSMIFFSTKIPSRGEFHLIIYCFLLGSLINTSWCYIYSFILHKNEVVRSASRFMSHIRLGLYLNVAIACSVYFITIHQQTLKRIAFGALALYFLFSMYALGLASGFANFFILCFLALCYLTVKQKLKIKLLLIAMILTGFYLMGHYVYKVYAGQKVLNASVNNVRQKKTISGRFYYHFDSPSQKENGNLVHINIQLEEIKNEWNRRCPADSFSYDLNLNMSRFQVLLRYMTSKGLNKDSVGLWSMSDQDIENIKNNITNYQRDEWSYFHRRIYELVNEYDEFVNNRTVNGHSLSMRLYFWKAAAHVIKNNFITGVGTGDVQAALDKAYVEIKAPLSEDWYKRPHNQYLTVMVALGVMGALVFLFSIFYPALKLRRKLHWLYWPFFTMAVISFLMEDTLETQAGLTFFAFFNVLFVSLACFENKEKKL